MSIEIRAIHWKNGACELLDTTRLPQEEISIRCEHYEEVVECIRRLAVRGAPAIGIAGAYAVVLAVKQSLDLSEKQRVPFLHNALEDISKARPTAINLRWAVDRMKAKAGWKDGISHISPVTETSLLEEAQAIFLEDIENNRLMAEHGLALLSENSVLMTYCNTGELCTAGIGTALGVIIRGYRQGKVNHVYTCETRPVLQGLRLTAWELKRNGIPFSAICDNMVGFIMNSRKVNGVFVGADRVAANGDTANKIGTYSLAVLANHHKVPFFIVAPTTSFDLSIPDGNKIPIEERNPEEILRVLGNSAPAFPVYNPSFDVTPHSLISGIICEKGVARPPFVKTLRGFMDKT